jgi:hypothetical protein
VSFSPGESIEIREMLDGKIWTVRPVTVVKDAADELVTYLAPDTVTRYPRGVEKGQVVLDMWRSGRWELGTARWWGPGVLRLTRPGDHFDVWAFRRDDGSLSHWYVNVGEPFRRAPHGFDTMDEILDVIVASDLSTWRWKDDWELALAVELGYYSERRAAAIRATATSVIKAVEDGKPPWDVSWAAWEPPTIAST